MTLLLALMLLLRDSTVPDEIPDEIVVVAKSGKCDLSIAGRAIGAPEFRRYAADWAAGWPVRVIVPANARTRCLAKIMFKLHDRGVTRAEFVDMSSP